VTVLRLAGHSSFAKVAGVFVCALLSAPSGGARADALSDLVAGIKAYDDGEPDRATTLLRRAARSLAAPRDRGLAFLYLGLCAISRKEEAKAAGAFREALTADPEVAPSRERVPPDALALFDRIRAGMAGELVIEATEIGALVLVGDRTRGTAPLRLRSPIGRHTVRVLSQDRLRHFEDRAVIVQPGRQTTITARLTPRMGRVILDVLPAGTEIYDGARLIAKTPTPPVPLPAGRTHLRLHATGFEPLTREVDVAPDETVSLTARLAPARSRPPWWKRRRPWGIVSLGVGAALAAGGLASGALARAAIGDIERGLRNRTLTMNGYNTFADAARAHSTRSNILLTIGGAGAALGVALIVWGDERATSARLGVSPAGLTIAGGF
jgi:hypothetical protein